MCAPSSETGNVSEIGKKPKHCCDPCLGKSLGLFLLIIILLIKLDISKAAEDEKLSQPEENKEEEGWGTLVAVTAMRGSTAQLPCNIRANDAVDTNDLRNENDPVLLVLWYKNASVTPVYSYDSRGQTSGPGGRQQWGDETVWGKEDQRARFDTSTRPAHLLIRDVRGRDEGAYRCKVHFKSSPSWSQRIDLTITDPPGFPKIQDESGARLEGPIGPYPDGSTVRMTCRSSGEPPPKLEWSGVVSRPSGSSRTEVTKGTAHSTVTAVASRHSSDSSISCTATSNVGGKIITNTSYVELQVNLPPISVRLEAPGAWVVGSQETEFRCRVVGARPKAIVQWWLAGRQLTRVSKSEVSADGNTTVSTIKLTPEAGDDGTLLVCKSFAINLPGTVLQDQLTLGVHYIPIASIKVGGDGQLKEGSGSVDVQERSTVLFSCHVQANPAAYNVTWYHNGKPLQERRTNPKILIDRRTLRLVNVTSERHGLYTCIASNEEGDGQSNAVNLNVYYSPRCRRDQPIEYVVERGGSVVISCGVEAFPSQVTFSWALKNDKGVLHLLPSVGRLDGLTGSYTVTKVNEDHLKILCWGTNTIGGQEDPCVFDIMTQGRPGVVSDCKVSNHTASGFVVQCPRKQRFHGALDTFYNLQVYAQSRATSALDPPHSADGGRDDPAPLSFGALDDLVRNHSSPDPQFVVEGLKPGREFAVVVRAANREGTSPPAVLSAFTLRDTAQTLKGMPSATSGSGSSGKKTSESGGTVSETKGKTENEDYLYDSDFSGGSIIPPMMIVLAASLVVIFLLSAAVVFGIRRRGHRRRVELEAEQQIKLTEELPYMQTKESISSTSNLKDDQEPIDTNTCESLLKEDTEGRGGEKPLEEGAMLDLPGQDVIISLVSPTRRSQIAAGMGVSRTGSPTVPMISPLNHILPSTFIQIPSSSSYSHQIPFSNMNMVPASGVMTSSQFTLPSSIHHLPSSNVQVHTSSIHPYYSSIQAPSLTVGMGSSTLHTHSPVIHLPPTSYQTSSSVFQLPPSSVASCSTLLRPSSSSSTLPRRGGYSATFSSSGGLQPDSMTESLTETNQNEPMLNYSQFSHESQLSLLGVKQLANPDKTSQSYALYPGNQHNTQSSFGAGSSLPKLSSAQETQAKTTAVTFNPMVHVNCVPDHYLTRQGVEDPGNSRKGAREGDPSESVSAV